eukprot:2989074-Prymnesium_polylepis.1
MPEMSRRGRPRLVSQTSSQLMQMKESDDHHSPAELQMIEEHIDALSKLIRMQKKEAADQN